MSQSLGTTGITHPVSLITLAQSGSAYTTRIIRSVWNVFVFSLLLLLSHVQVFSEYFKELEEESIRDNFVIIYELLDELMDFGYPQTTDSKILQE